ncbi:erythromycin biosynthesis sensory transduction protein EryC1 [Pseudomonas straminea]|uniref:dTDP-4-amino-4,6-dideoxygalactose transaminase n=1 Tax=Pseudomonas straminea TaxID=47882 RepID=A0A1I1SQJ0_PSEOC|nr:DegT/DnrJ/EryC1/StrS family aminotransferase [Pseudomonas straminea]GLX12536.1 erythromycin biosynthesis sensory transduction protein EryC1 [Pseudomonas straminea]SFD48706.1 dTDP-4-amino-4,6-dideoxygalactose transaminase [Pseudomonas straminea]
MIVYEDLARLNAPFFEDFKKAFNLTLESGWYVLGEQVRSFEAEFASFLGVQFCSGVASGLDAMVIALKALDLPPDSEVIVPANTYIATILAVLQAGLRPVLVEPELVTYNIDPSKIEAHITKKTKAILVVHLYGKACEMDPILSLCEKHGLRLLEDCAQSHGATYKGRLTGSFGDFGCFSFYPTKNLGALGDAGAIVCNSEELDQKVRVLRNYGSARKYYNDVVGLNSRLDEIQASFLRVKLKRLNDINKHKKALAEIYLSRLSDEFIKPCVRDGFSDVFHIFNIRHPRRDELKAFLHANGVGAEIHYPVAPHRQNAMRAVLNGEYPISELIHDTTLSLPVSYFHSFDEVNQVCDIANRFASS